MAEADDNDEEMIETLEIEQNTAEVLTNSKVFFFYLTVSIFGLSTYFIDLISDFLTAYRHLADGHNKYAAVTLVLVFSPSLAFAAFAIYKCILNTDLGFRKKIIYIPLYVVFSAFLLLWPIWRYSQMVFYSAKAMKNKAKRNLYISKVKIIENDENAAVQIILEAFMESAPQSLFQLYIIFKNSIDKENSNDQENSPEITTYVLIVSTIISMISLSNVVVKCQINSEHHMTVGKSVGRAYVVEYLWWFMSIGSRIVALAFFAAIFKELLFVICSIHCLTVSFCLVANRPGGCSDWPLMFAIGIIYIFCFIEYKVDFGQLGKTVGLYILYYVFIFIQNTCMMFSAYFVSGKYSWKVAIMVLHYVTFFLAVGLMLFYLGLLRPVLIKMANIKRDLKHREKPPAVI